MNECPYIEKQCPTVERLRELYKSACTISEQRRLEIEALKRLNAEVAADNLKLRGVE